MTEVQPFILIVDDDLAVRDSLSFSLMLDGLEVKACQDGADLVAHPDLPRFSQRCGRRVAGIP